MLVRTEEVVFSFIGKDNDNLFFSFFFFFFPFFSSSFGWNGFLLFIGGGEGIWAPFHIQILVIDPSREYLNQ
jgi:hypothetical protein